MSKEREVDKGIAMTLCVFLGCFGAHKFYEGDFKRGTLYLFTMGVFGVGWICDIIAISRKPSIYIVRKEERTPKKVSYEKKCPRCGSLNHQVYVEEAVLIKGKVKTTTSLNLNPFKPFTLFNHNEKVVREPLTMKVSKFVCNDCGKIFN